MKTLLLVWLLVAALDVPVVQTKDIDKSRIRLEWSHPDCYQFDIRQIGDGVTTTNAVFFRSLQVQKKHIFRRDIKPTGVTNKIQIRAVNEIRPTEKSEWSQVITVIYGP